MDRARHLGNRVSAIAATVIGLSSPAWAQPDDYDGDDGDGEYETPTQVDHEGGFVWTTADDAYQLRLGGFLQARWELERQAADSDNGFALNHARPVIDGTGEHDLGFHFMAELVDPALVEGWLEWRDGPLGVRAGKDRVPFLRSGVMPEEQYAFAERAAVTAAYGWDRDVGVSLRFRPARLPVGAIVMVANGGPDATPDDVPLVAMRITATRGDKPDPGEGDRSDTAFSFTLGVGVVFDAVSAPAMIGDTAITNDLDGDGEAERVMTVTNALDLTVRKRGLELALEGVVRLERWGQLMLANPMLVDDADVDPETGAAAYMAGSAQLTYLFANKLMIGGRFAGGRVPFLSTHGPSAIPLGRSVVEGDAVLGIYRGGSKIFDLTYRYLNWGQHYGSVPGDGPIEHCVMAEAQVVL